MIKGYKVSETDSSIHCACEIECEGGVQQFKAELTAIFNGIRENPFLHYLMTEVMREIMEEEEEESEIESKRVN